MSESQNFDVIYQRVQKATGTSTQTQLAELLNIRQSSISDAKRRQSVPAEWYLKLYRHFGLNPDWVSDGTEPIYLSPDKAKIPADVIAKGLRHQPEQLQVQSRKVSVYPMLDAPGAEVWNPSPISELIIADNFWKESLKVVLVDGGGMEPFIKRKAFVGLDTSQRNILAGEIYAVYIPPEGLVLKWVYSDPDNDRFILRSQNKDHPEHHITIQDLEKRMVGKIVWVMQNM